MAHIFIIDDSPTEVRVLTGFLEKAGHRVSSAPSAEEGIDQVRRARPDLVIMDIIMPGMNGFQATRQLSRDAATSAIPVVMVTTKAMETDRIWALRQGAKAFMTKPVAEKELLGQIDGLLSA